MMSCADSAPANAVPGPRVMCLFMAAGRSDWRHADVPPLSGPDFRESQRSVFRMPTGGVCGSG